MNLLVTFMHYFNTGFFHLALEIKCILVTQIFYNIKFGGYVYFTCEVQIKSQKCQTHGKFSFHLTIIIIAE